MPHKTPQTPLGPRRRDMTLSSGSLCRLEEVEEVAPARVRAEHAHVAPMVSQDRSRVAHALPLSGWHAKPAANTAKDGVMIGPDESKRWATLCERHEAAKRAVDLAVRVVQNKFLGIGGTPGNPSREDLAPRGCTGKARRGRARDGRVHNHPPLSKTCTRGGGDCRTAADRALFVLARQIGAGHHVGEPWQTGPKR